MVSSSSPASRPEAVSDAQVALLAAELAADQPAITQLSAAADLTRLSRDFYDYSPLLRQRLQGCRAQLALKVRRVEEVIAVAAACARHRVPLTPRGAGTGNYGQSVPLAGGVVLDLSGLNRIRDLDPATGVLEAEAGALLHHLEQHLRPAGRALRLMPSTWRTASVGGYIAGGSSGVGSLRWGFLRDPGNLLGLEVVTLEPEPRLIRLDAAASVPLNHAYGTNGILTAVRLATCEAVTWQQLVVDFTDPEAALAAAAALPATALLLQSITLLEGPIAARLPSPPGCPAADSGASRLLLLAGPDSLAVLPAWLEARGGRLRWQAPEGEEASARPLRELGWNHTTLHWRAQHPDWTYLQMLLPEPAAPLIAAVRQRWGDDVLWHLEAVRHAGAARLAGLPLLRWRDATALAALMDQCRQLGAVIFDPHVLTVEDGGLGVIDADQVAAKAANDPAGLLNPGKLRGWDAR